MQQTVINTDNRQPVYFSQPYQTVSVVSAYRGRQSIAIGILLIIAGSLSIVFNIVDLAIGNSGYRNWLSYASNGVSGHGIWCGALVLVAGALGIPAGQNKSRCMIVSFMVMAIIGCIFAGIQALVAGTGANRVYYVYNYIYVGCGFCGNEAAETVFAMAVLMALAGTAGFFLCLWGSILGCATGDCCGGAQAVAVIPEGQQQVTVVSQQQQQHPMSSPYMAPQAAYPGYQQPQVYPGQPLQPPDYPGYQAK